MATPVDDSSKRLVFSVQPAAYRELGQLLRTDGHMYCCSSRFTLSVSPPTPLWRKTHRLTQSGLTRRIKQNTSIDFADCIKLLVEVSEMAGWSHGRAVCDCIGQRHEACSSPTPHFNALHSAEERTDGAVFGFGTQELCVFVGELDVPQLPPAVQAS